MLHLEVSPSRQGKCKYLEKQADRQQQSVANRIKDIKVTLLERKIQHLDRVIRCPERELIYAEEMLEYKYKIDGMQDRNGRLAHWLQENEIKYDQRQTEKRLNELHEDFDIIFTRNDQKVNKLQKRIHDSSITEEYSKHIIRQRNHELSELKTQLQQTKRKLNETDKAYALLKEENQAFIQNTKEKDRESSELRYQLQQTKRMLKENEATADKAYALLKEKNKELIQNMVKEKNRESSEQRYQLQQTKRKLKENEAKADKAYAILKEKNKELIQNMVKEKDRESSELRYQLQQIKRNLKETEANKDKADVSLKEKNQELFQIMVEKDRESSEVRYQLQQTKRKLKETEANMDRADASLKHKNEEYIQNMFKEKDRESSEVKYQLQQTKRKLTETEATADKADASLKEKNQELSQIIVEKDRELSELKYQLQQTKNKMKETEANMDKADASLKHKNQEYVHSMLKEKDRESSQVRYQLQQTKRELSETVAKADKAYASIKEQNQSFQVQMKRRDHEVEHLKEMLKSEKKEINEIEERQVRNEMRQKDDKITDLNHQLKKALERPVEIEAEMNGIISSLKKHNADLQKEIERRDRKTQDSLHYKKKEIIELNEHFDNKVKEKDFQLREQKDQHQNILKKMQEKETEMTDVIASLKKKIKQLESEMEHRNLNIKQLEKELNSEKIATAAIKEPDVMEMEDKINQLTDELDQTLTKLQNTKTELDDTKTRLSKAMGNMLTDNNPNIADLSDKNRPTKLSERYAELYDNQWTDAFDILENYFHAEENAIAALLHILKDTMTFCRNKAHEQMEDIRGVLALSNDKKYGGISADLGKLLKDCRKAMASTAVDNLYMMYMSHINQSSDGTTRAALQVSSFTKECLEVCWFMAIQDPPVVFAPELRKGSKFNTDLFKPYTSSGTHVDYIVWPALLLHEGGPVLAKGVAQGDGNKAT